MPTTRDHEIIKAWIEARGGRPAKVKGTEDLLRIDFGYGKPKKDLEEITWGEFFEIFESRDLSFLYEQSPESRFSRFIRTESKAA